MSEKKSQVLTYQHNLKGILLGNVESCEIKHISSVKSSQMAEQANHGEKNNTQFSVMLLITNALSRQTGGGERGSITSLGKDHLHLDLGPITQPDQKLS